MQCHLGSLFELQSERLACPRECKMNVPHAATELELNRCLSSLRPCHMKVLRATV